MTRAAIVLGALIASLAAIKPVGAAFGGAASLAMIGVAWLCFAGAVWSIGRVPGRAAVVLILAGAVGAQLAAGFGGPGTSDDIFRYVWDGRVQAAGIDPYRYAPAAPELVPLRDPQLWPDRPTPWCVDARDGVAAGCTRINRPTVRTIYPPVAQAVFLATHGGGVVAVRVAMGLACVATTILLLFGLRDPRQAALWAWCPTVAIESAANGHIDAAAAGLTVAALLTLASARRTRATIVGGALLGLAIATKVTPALTLPAVMRRRPLPVLAAAVATVAAVYLPHVLAVGGSVIGYLPGYLDEEGYASGSRFALLAAILPPATAQFLAALVLLAVVAEAYRRADPAAPWDSAALVVGASLLLTSPFYTWYAVLLVALVGLGAPAIWLIVPALSYIAQYGGALPIGAGIAQRLAYGLALLVLALASMRRRGWRQDPAAEMSVPNA